jgi:hypothetical protein
MADNLGPNGRFAQNLSKISSKIEQSLERFLNYILLDFERSDNIQSKVLIPKKDEKTKRNENGLADHG